MRKRKFLLKGYRPEPGADFGPTLRMRSDGRLVPWGSAAVVDLHYRHDPAVAPSQRLLRGARRRDVLADLEAHRTITKRQRDAAERFLEDCSIAAGGSSMAEVFMPSLPGPRSGLPERQLLALGRVKQVRQLLDQPAAGLFWWVVFENRSLADYEDHHRVRHGTASSLLCAALERLDVFYFETTRRISS